MSHTKSSYEAPWITQQFVPANRPNRVWYVQMTVEQHTEGSRISGHEVHSELILGVLVQHQFDDTSGCPMPIKSQTVYAMDGGWEEGVVPIEQFCDTAWTSIVGIYPEGEQPLSDAVSTAAETSRLKAQSALRRTEEQRDAVLAARSSNYSR